MELDFPVVIYKYINKLNKGDIVNYCNMYGIKVNNDDLDTVYGYIKNEYRRFFDNPNSVLNEIKSKVSDYTYSEIIKLYNKYKDFI